MVKSHNSYCALPERRFQRRTENQDKAEVLMLTTDQLCGRRIKQFELVAELNEWDSKRKATFLGVSLTIRVQAVLAEHDRKHQTRIYHSDTVTDNRFQNSNKMEMSQAMQKAETVQEVVQAIRHLSQ